MRLPIVAKENNQCVVSQTVGLQLLQDQSNFAVELTGRIEILRPIRARDRIIRIVRREFYLRRIGAFWGVKFAVRFLEINLRKEWLMRLKLIPAIRIERLS